VRESDIFLKKILQIKKGRREKDIWSKRRQMRKLKIKCTKEKGRKRNYRRKRKV